MPAEAIPGQLSYRIVNRLTGAVVIPSLPHLHTSYWRVNAMQQGAPGSAAVGTFRIPLYPPQTDDYRAAKAFYDQLDYGLRVEGYLGPVGAGAPRYAGIITGIKKGFNAYELTGLSDVGLAHGSKLFPSELLTTVFAASSDGVFRYYKYLNEMAWGDDFSAYSAGNYTAIGSWTTATNDGLNTITCSAGPNSQLRYTAAQKVALVAEASGRITSSLGDAANSGMAGVGRLKDGGPDKYIVGRLVVKSDSSVDVQIVVIDTGVVTVKATAANVFTGLTFPWRFTIQLVTVYSAGGFSTARVRVMLNGKDCGISYDDSNAAITDPLLHFNAPAAGTAQVWFSRLVGLARQHTFYTQGTIGTGTRAFQSLASIGGQSLLDLWTMAATLEGWYWRYTPSALTAANGVLGTMDYGLTPGTDRSTSVRFVEGDNLIDASIEPNAEFFATSVRVPSAPYGDSSASVSRNLAAITTYGLIEDVLPVIGAADFYTLDRHSTAIIANKTNLNNAKVITVLRDPQTADVWRELDYVTVHAPTLGLNYVKALVMAYDFTEGSGTQNLWLDQFAVGGYELPAARMRVAHINVASAFAGR